MADKKYVSVVGFIQFDPQEREANGKPVTDVVVKTLGGEGRNIKVTIWPEIQVEGKLERGDVIAVDGQFSSSVYQDKAGESQTSYQISAYYLAKLGSAFGRTDREVVQGSSAPAAAASTTVPF